MSPEEIKATGHPMLSFYDLMDMELAAILGVSRGRFVKDIEDAIGRWGIWRIDILMTYIYEGSMPDRLRAIDLYERLLLRADEPESTNPEQEP